MAAEYRVKPWVSVRSLAICGLVLCALAWAGNALIARAVVGVVPPIALSFLRWVLALVLLLPFTWRSIWQYRSVIMLHRWRLMLLSLLGVALFNSLLYLAAVSTTAINITLVNTGLPVAVLVWSVLLLKEWPSGTVLIGTGFSFVGLLTILMQGEWSRVLNLEFNNGDLVMSMAVLVWGLYTVLVRYWKLPLPGLVQLAVMIACGVVLLAPFYAWEVIQVGSTKSSWSAFAAISYTAVIASLFAHQAWTAGIREVGPALASLFSYLIPLFTALLAVFFLGEQLQVFHLVGGLLTFAGLLLAVRAK
ncbi:DMT family transporter [Pseudomonas profundi]|uniref:DMT family transporter n=1 Tax=Pseudomonas profundi TaxID=1981513 RepID=UPI00123AF7E1|nr:DMT family transporter [Pseudomonas profundi]